MDVNKTLLGGSDAFLVAEAWSQDEVGRLPARTLAYIPRFGTTPSSGAA